MFQTYLIGSLLVIIFAAGVAVTTGGCYILIQCRDGKECSIRTEYSVVLTISGVAVTLACLVAGIVICIRSLQEPELEESESETFSYTTSTEDSTPRPSVLDITPDGSEAAHSGNLLS